MSNFYTTPSRRLALVTAALSVASVAGACGDHHLGPSTPASVAILSGDRQTLLVGDRASAPLVAEIKNTDGSPLPNVPVRWAVISGGGSLDPVSDTTDVNGQVHATYLSPAKTGTAKVTALAASQVATFTLTLAADTIGAISAYGGDGAAALVGSQLTLTVKAADRFGNAIRGVGVSWSANSGALQTSSGTTDSTGKTTNVITVGPDTGKVAIVASSRFNTVTFTVTSLHSN